MVKIKVSADSVESVSIVGAMVVRALRESGVKVTHMEDVGRNEVGTCVKDAKDSQSDVLVMEMRP